MLTGLTKACSDRSMPAVMSLRYPASVLEVTVSKTAIKTTVWGAWCAGAHGRLSSVPWHRPTPGAAGAQSFSQAREPLFRMGHKGLLSGMLGQTQQASHAEAACLESNVEGQPLAVAVCCTMMWRTSDKNAKKLANGCVALTIDASSSGGGGGAQGRMGGGAGGEGLGGGLGGLGGDGGGAGGEGGAGGLGGIGGSGGGEGLGGLGGGLGGDGGLKW